MAAYMHATCACIKDISVNTQTKGLDTSLCCHANRCNQQTQRNTGKGVSETINNDS